MDIEKLNKIKFPNWILVLSFLSGVIAPAFLFIFLYDKELFISLDFWKLLLFGLSIALCAWIANTLSVITGYSIIHGRQFGNVNESTFLLFARLGNIYCGILFLTLIISTSITNKFNGFKECFVFALTFQVVIIIQTILFELIDKFITNRLKK